MYDMKYHTTYHTRTFSPHLVKISCTYLQSFSGKLYSGMMLQNKPRVYKMTGLVVQPPVGLLEVNIEHEHNEHSSSVWMMQGVLFPVFAYIRIIFGSDTE
jgi:hypothetical protein